MTRWIILIATTMILLLVGCTIKQVNSATVDTSTLQDSLLAILSKSKIPGFAVAIVKDDSVVFSGGFGFANRKTKKPYTPQTIQPIASISKTFIGLALMKAIDQRYFTLETNVNDILPFKVTNPYQPESIIRIKHLATHTSGLIDNDSIFLASYTIKQKPETDFQSFFKEYFTPSGDLFSLNNFGKSKAGEHFSYSNIASALAAYVIELKSGLSFPEYTSKYIFKPLQMNDTHWFYDTSKAESYATLYEITKHSSPDYKILLNADNTVKPYTDVTYPDGKLYSSLEDMTKYLRAMITSYPGKAGILSSGSFQTLFSKQFNDINLPSDVDKQEPNRGIFWAYDSKGRITHTGSDYGLTSFILFNPQTKIGRVVLFNTAFDRSDNEKPIADVMAILGCIANFEKTYYDFLVAYPRIPHAS